MAAATDDIITPRLVLRLMEREVVDACLAGDLAHAAQLLGAAIPAELLDRPSSLQFAQIRLHEDPEYRLWSARAMILPNTQSMIGNVRFHTRPDPEYLRPFGPAAVEIGYQVFPAYRRRGYAREAVAAVMDWAHAAFGVRRFIASVSPDNKPSLALIAHFGFAKVGQQIDEIDGIEDIYLREASP